MKKIFSFGGQWNVVHLPDQPNGFAILIIGDVNHYVDDKTSLWIQNPERFRLIESLCAKGYTVYYSNLFGKHWGSEKSVEFLKQLHAYMIRKEILNSRIHILAEGMGALSALKLMEELPENIRSTVLLSPCIDLKQYYYSEKNNRVFYKKLRKEIAESYSIYEKEVQEQVIDSYSFENYQNTIPIKIWHATNRTSYPVLEHSRPFEAHRQMIDAPVSLSIHLFEKRFMIAESIVKFFQSNEKDL